MTRLKHRLAPLPASVRLEFRARTGQRFVPFLRRGLKNAFVILQPALEEISIALVGDVIMSNLHDQYLGISGPTDVLTFPLDCNSDGHVTSGEIVICVPHAVRQARLHRIEVSRELLLYALHGALHLAGFDDKTDRGFRQMHRKEDEILTALGHGPVFVRSSADHPPATRSRSRGAR